MSVSNMEDNVRYFYNEKNHNCAETLLLAANKTYDLGLNESHALLLSGFGGGMYTGNVCGALAGCTSALGCMLVETKAHECEALPSAQRLLVRNFRSLLGDTQCGKIKPVHHTENERCLNTCLLAGKAFEQTVAQLKEEGLLK